MNRSLKVVFGITVIVIAAISGYLAYHLQGGYLLETQGFDDFSITKRSDRSQELHDYLRAIGAYDQGLTLTQPGDTRRVRPRLLRLIITDQVQPVPLALDSTGQLPIVSYATDYHPFLGLYTIRLYHRFYSYYTPEVLAQSFSANLLRLLARQASQSNLGDQATLQQINDLVSTHLNDAWGRLGPIDVRPRAGRLGGFRLIPQAYALNCGYGIIECGTLAGIYGCYVDGQPGYRACPDPYSRVCDGYGGCNIVRYACYFGVMLDDVRCDNAITCYGNPCPTNTQQNCLFYRNCAFPPGLPPPPPPTPIVAEVFLPRL